MQANLHRLEAMLKRAADGQYFCAALEVKMKLAEIVALNPLNRIGVHQQAAVHLPKHLGIQTGHQLF